MAGLHACGLPYSCVVEVSSSDVSRTITLSAVASTVVDPQLAFSWVGYFSCRGVPPSLHGCSTCSSLKTVLCCSGQLQGFKHTPTCFKSRCYMSALALALCTLYIHQALFSVRRWPMASACRLAVLGSTWYYHTFQAQLEMILANT